MAAVDSSQESECKVSCCSRRSVNNIIDLVEQETSKLISKNADWSEEQIEACKSRFRQIFSTVLQKHVNIDGESWDASGQDNLNSTTEFEPVNFERKKYVNGVLLEKLNDTLKETTRKRKTHPRLCKQHTVDNLNADFEYLQNVKVKATNDTLSMAELPSTTDWKAIHEKTEALSQTIKKLTKEIPDLQCKAERLQSSVELCDTMAVSSTDKVIFKPVADEAVMAKSMTPLVKRLRMPSTPKQNYDSQRRRRSTRTAVLQKQYPLK